MEFIADHYSDTKSREITLAILLRPVTVSAFNVRNVAKLDTQFFPGIRTRRPFLPFGS